MFAEFLWCYLSNERGRMASTNRVSVGLAPANEWVGRPAGQVLGNARLCGTRFSVQSAYSHISLIEGTLYNGYNRIRYATSTVPYYINSISARVRCFTLLPTDLPSVRLFVRVCVLVSVTGRGFDHVPSARVHMSINQSVRYILPVLFEW